MKIHTVFSATHEPLLRDWFLPSFHKHHDGSRLVIHESPQICASGDYFSEGWRAMMLHKCGVMRDAVASTKIGEWACYADCDIQFFGNIDNALERYQKYGADVLAQDDGGEACAGFMVMRHNHKVLAMLDGMLNGLESGRFHCDQPAFNALYRPFHVSVVRLGPEFYSVWRSIGAKRWEGGPIGSIPDKMVLHHANFTVGVAHKIELMQRVRDLVTAAA